MPAASEDGDERQGWPTRRMTEEQKFAYLNVHINAFVDKQRLDVALAPEDIGELPAMRRLRALRNSLLIAAARHCRENSKADTGLAILIFLTLLADNEEGICWLSYRSMEAIFGRRSMETVVSNIERMEREGQIGVLRRNRAMSGYWPLIHPDLVTIDPHPATLAKALVQARSGEPTRGPQPHMESPSAGPTPHIDRAIKAYNEAAAVHGWKAWSPALTNSKRRARVAAALHRIGGIDAFRRALAAIPANSFLMGRARPSAGQAPFQLTMEYLLRNEGEALAALIEADAHTASTKAAAVPATPPPELDDRSGRLHAALEQRVGAAVYGSWFRTMVVERIEGDRLTVSVITPFVCQHVAQQYDTPLTDAARAAFGDVRRVEVMVRKTTP
jgi:hypothetical protein